MPLSAFPVLARQSSCPLAAGGIWKPVSPTSSTTSHSYRLYADTYHGTDISSGKDGPLRYNDSVRVHLVRTPEPSPPTDEDTGSNQDAINDFIDNFHADGKSFSGIILLHPISDRRSTEPMLSILQTFRAKCGSGEYPSIALATSKWSDVTADDGERRETELVEGDSLVSHMREEGYRIFRYNETSESATEIIGCILAQRGFIPTDPSAEAEVEVEDTQDEGTVVPDEMDASIAVADRKRMARLADLYEQMDQTMKDHDASMQRIFRAEIASLRQRIREGIEEQQRLQREIEDIIFQKDSEITAVREKAKAESDQARQRHLRELVQHARATQEDMMRLEASNHQERQEVLAASKAEMTREADERVRAIKGDMTRQADERITAAKEEVAREAEQRLNALCAEMDKMKAEFKLEREQYTKAMEAEMARVAKREQEARERALRAEMAQKNDDYKQPLQAWAVGRLFGVGSYARAR